MGHVKNRVFASVFLLASVAVIKAADWTYDPKMRIGPPYWHDVAAECAANRQSPINLVDEEVTSVTYDDFVFQGYDSQEVGAHTLLSIANVGHTAFIQLNGTLRISGGGLPTEYEAVQAHFHWGAYSQQGSEHAINGRLFPLEMHIVHYAYQEYNSSIFSAVTSGKRDAVAVLGILFEIGENDNDYFDELITGVSNIINETSKYTFSTPISLSSLLPEDTSRFYRYDGSLTTPPCYEVVQWTVFEETVIISERQMNYFRQLREGPHNASYPIGDTYRPLQPRRDRVVYRAYRESTEVTTTKAGTTEEVETCGKATMTKPLSLLTATVAILLFLLKDM